MARNNKGGTAESPIEHWVGTALAGLVLAKVALPHRNDQTDEPGGATNVAAGDAARATRAPLRVVPQTAMAAPAQDAAQAGRGRQADRPTEIPASGWKDIGWRVGQEIKDDGVPLLAAGVTYYAMLALFPALVAVVSIYGLVASPSQVAPQLSSLTRAMPTEARQLIVTQLTAVAQKSTGGLGVSAVIGILAALWSASSGMRWLMTALSKVYDEREDRKFLKMRGAALLLTTASIVGGVVALGLLVAMPSVFRLLGLAGAGKIIISILRWPLLAALVVTGLSALYRYGPNRDEPKWRWVSWGSAIATAIWLLGSVGFSLYASTFGKFDKTYGALGAVIVLMLWLFLSAFAVLVGAEINAEIEHQTARDTTVGPEEPMGARRATMADEVGATKPAKAS